MSGKTNRKHGGNKRSPSMATYRAAERWKANKKRNIATEARRQKIDEKLKPAREKLRKIGALKRFEKHYDERLRSLSSISDRTVYDKAVDKLNEVRAKVRAAAA